MQLFQDLEDSPNESTHFFYTSALLEILGDEGFQPLHSILYPTTQFENNLLRLLHGIRTEIKGTPPTVAPLPPAPNADVTPMVTALGKKLEDLKRETSSSLKSFADAVKASTPALALPLLNGKFDSRTCHIIRLPLIVGR